MSRVHCAVRRSRTQRRRTPPGRAAKRTAGQAGESFPLSPSCPPNTRDQLRRAHDLTLAHDGLVADDDAPIRIQPPFVSCITLFDGAPPASWAVRPDEFRCSPRRLCFAHGMVPPCCSAASALAPERAGMTAVSRGTPRYRSIRCLNRSTRAVNPRKDQPPSRQRRL